MPDQNGAVEAGDNLKILPRPVALSKDYTKDTPSRLWTYDQMAQFALQSPSWLPEMLQHLFDRGPTWSSEERDRYLALFADFVAWTYPGAAAEEATDHA